MPNITKRFSMDVVKGWSQRIIAASLDRLPLEIWHVIFYHLDIRDILRMRRVSRYLNEVSRCRDVWSDAYRKAEFICPPGPFLSQSADDLENALVPSFRVSRNLRHDGDATQTERSMRQLREILFKGVDLGVSLVFARFLLIAFSEEVRYYDLDRADSDPSIVYRATSGTLKSFHCVSAFDVEGRRFACAVLNEATQTMNRISIYLLSAGEKPKVTLDLVHQFERSTFDVNAVDLGPRAIVIQARLSMGYDLDASRDLIVVDVHTRTQLLLPSLSRATWETNEMSEFWLIERVILPTSISTSTHLLLAKSIYNPITGWVTFFQAFALPSSDTHRSCTIGSTSIHLSLSHSGIIPSVYVGDTILLHDSVLDPTTRDILIAIRVHAFEPARPNSSLLNHGILRLSAAPTSNPNNHEVGTVAFRLLGSLGQLRAPFFHPSFNGAGRVFHTLQVLDARMSISALEYDLRAPGGDNDGDGDGEQTAKVVEYPCILRFPTRRMLWDYDPYFGRLCIRSSRAEVSVIEVLDLAV